MSEAIDDRAGGLAALGFAYFQRRYAILFYSLLLTIAASPLVASIGFDTDLIDWFLAVNLLAAVIPISGFNERRLLLIIVIAALILRFATGWLNQATFAAASLMIWTVVALVAAGGALSFAFRARSVDREHVYAALSAYLLAGIFFGSFYWVLEEIRPGSFTASAISPPAARSILVSSPWRPSATATSYRAAISRAAWPSSRELADSFSWR